MSRATARNADDVDRLAGDVVDVVGRYEQQDMRMKPVGEPELRGHVALVLEDDTFVYLYPPAKPEARRPAEEIQASEHRMVRATGLLYGRIPQEGAVPMGGCLVEVESVDVVG